MGREDVTAGKIKRAKGKANDLIGAATDNPARQLKGKLQKAAGRVQEEVGRRSGSRRDSRR
jgi:uncharacterized protein YjbJ (UPF0337 family)